LSIITEKFIKIDMIGIRDAYSDRRKQERYADSRLSHYAEVAITEKLKIARNKGRHGWWSVKLCSLLDLKQRLQESHCRGDMANVMVYAAMIYARECADGLELGKCSQCGDPLRGHDDDGPTICRWCDTGYKPTGKDDSLAENALIEGAGDPESGD